MILRPRGILRRQWMNMFEITNLNELAVDYRLVEIRNLPQDDSYDKNVQQLVKKLNLQLRMPVALCERSRMLAVPADAQLPNRQVQLSPHVIELVPQMRTHNLRLHQIPEDQVHIARQFLSFALRAPLRDEQGLWGMGSIWFTKEVLQARSAPEVEIYPGFSWNLECDVDRRFFVAIDTLMRYVDAQTLFERSVKAPSDDFK